MKRVWAPIGLLCALALVAGCGRSSVEGFARNVQGEAVPGVAVRLVGTEYRALTDARGHYRISYSGSTQRLSFSKSGYAPVEIAFEGAGRVAANDAKLWQLPRNAGVYLYENDRYHQTAWVLPKQYLMADGTVSYGTRRAPETASSSNKPFIVCYRTPRYDARLTRLVESDSKQPGSNKGITRVWTAAGSVAADLTPVDPLQGQLLKLRVDQELEPGIYAIHWGAMEGYVTLDSRVFLLEIKEQAIAATLDAAVTMDSPVE